MDTVEAYIAQYPQEVQVKLRQLRAVILEAAPEAKEKIAWGMPSFMLEGTLVHFALQKRHIGFYPGSSGVEAFQQKLANYKTTKGGIQFPLDQPIPYELVREITLYRVDENKKDALAKKTPKA